MDERQSYDFDYTIVFRDIATGRYYVAHDAGCSCPVPFEDFNSLSDMEYFNYDEVRRSLGEHLDSDKLTFLDKIRWLTQPPR